MKFALRLHLPESVHHGAREFARREGVSINQLISTAIAEKLAVLATQDFIAQRAAQADPVLFAQALAQVPKVPAQAGDEWPVKPA